MSRRNGEMLRADLQSDAQHTGRHSERSAESPAVPLRIGIDVRPALSAKTGDRTYTLNLVRALAEVDHENEYFLLTDRPPPAGLFPISPNFHASLLASSPRWLFTPVTLPLFALRERLDVVHVQYIMPLVCSCPVVTTIHDVTFALFPDLFPLKHRVLLRTLIPIATMQAARIITGSEQAKRDLLACYGPLGVPVSRVTVTPYAAGPSYAPMSPEEVDHVKCKHGIDRPYVLAVGVLQPRKNFPALTEAFARVVVGNPPFPHVLCVAGKPGWGQTPTTSDRVRLLGYVPDEDLPALFSGCDLFVHPALYEGFGLPALEAMACGAAVACSTGGALAEVVGDAALTFDPHDSDAMACAIGRALADEGLRASLRERGLARAGEFSWQRTAEQTLHVYREVAGRA